MFLIDDDYLNNISIIDENGESFTYKDIKLLVKKFSSFFSKRTLVFLLASNDLETIIAYLSFLNEDIVLVLLSEDIKENTLDALADKYNPEFIISKKKKINNFEIKNKFKNTYIYCNNSTNKIKLHKDLSLLLTTSGSTGSPKFVKITKKNITSNANSISKFLEINFSDRSISNLPFNYSYGLSVINSHFFKGASIVLTNKSMMEKEFWEKVKNHKVTNIQGVPFHYKILLKLDLEKIEIPSIKFMTQAGGKLEDDLIQKIANILVEKKIKFYLMYGQTEATARISYLDYKYLKLKKGSIGKSIPGGQLWLQNEIGERVNKKNTIGELIYNGPNVSMGYAYNIVDLSAGDTNKSILKTGDLAYYDDEGFYYLAGKINRVVKIFGHRVSLDSLESLIKSLGYSAAVVGKEDEILICIKGADNSKKKEILKKISDKVEVNIRSLRVINLKEFPILKSGKIDYEKLKNEHL